MAETALNDDDPVYVAVCKNVRESKLNLLWALRNLRVKKLFLLHVHQQVPMNPSSSGLEQSEIDAIQVSELKSSIENIYKYRDICEDEGVVEGDVDISSIGAKNVEEGIVELIYENNIKKLVMGAAANSHYTEDMVHRSTKAEYVSHYAPHCCKIWLVCNGNFIETREGRFDLVDPSISSSESSSSLALTPYEGAASESSRSLALIPYEGAGNDTESPEDLSIMYNEEETHIREVEEELNEANAEIEEVLRCLHLENLPLVSNEPPSYFLCPIRQEVMREPLIAADGFSYEAEAIRKWLDNGHNTSPMTNLKLDHNNLVPNRALRSATQEWLQRNS